MERFVQEVVSLIKSATTAITTRVDALEQRMLSVKDGDPGSAGPQGEKGLDGAHGKDGIDGINGRDGKDGRDGVDGETGPQGPQGPPGAPGAAGLNGEKGMDGRDGKDGRDGQAGMPGRDGMKGDPGRDGIDGLGFDDLDVVHDGERTVTFTFTKGEIVKAFPVVFNVPLFRGVFEEKDYAQGDMVQFGGNLYYAQRATSQKPSEHGEGAKDWKLAVRRGRDGKEGPRGLEGPQGKHGKDWSGR